MRSRVRSFAGGLAVGLLVAIGAPHPAAAQEAEAASAEEPEDLLWDTGPEAAWSETAAETQGGEITLEASAPDDELPPWRGSEIIYGNEVGIQGLDRGADLTWNPYWAMSWGFKVRWWFDDTWFAGARIDVDREITEADERSFQGETWVHDLLLSGGAANVATIPVVEIGISPDLILTVPTSKVSQARTMALGIGPGLLVTREFDLDPVGSLTLGYHVRFTGFLHNYTTAELETPLIPSCTRSEAGCAEFLNTGVRNVRYRVQHGVAVGWQPLEWLAASIAFEHLVSWLYPIEAEDPRVTFQAEDDVGERYSSVFDVGVTFVPWSPIEIDLGYATIAPQLAPDSTYYNPFYNRYSMLYLNVRLGIAGLVDELTSLGTGEAE